MQFIIVAAAIVLVTAGWTTAQAAPGAPRRQAVKSAHSSGVKLPRGGILTVTGAGERQYELTFSGRKLLSRSEVERYLLYRSALLTIQRGYDWFVFLPLRGEGGPDDHPVRSDATITAPYGHWQPHWSYHQRSIGWQPWHPEWGSPFWANTVNLKDVDHYQAHAMVEVGRGETPSGEQTAFDAAKVLRDLK